MRGLRTCFPYQYVTFDAQMLSHLQTHAGLWLDKYLPEQEDQNKKGDKQQNENTQSVNSPRMAHIQSVAALTLPPDHPYRAFYKRWKTLLCEDDKTQMRYATVKGRMIVGLGDESVLETSVTLHQTYGIPYIPGSALKGLAASYIHQYAGRTGDVSWQKESEAYKILFGDTNDAGYITFFDALYVPDTGPNKQALWPDIITVHHQKYYQGEQAPADWDSPIPVPFLSATGKYLIALTAPDLPPESAWLNRAFDILDEALRELGIGAKTSSGYGRMELEKTYQLAETLNPGASTITSSTPEALDPEARTIAGYIKEVNELQNKSDIVAGRIYGYYERWKALQAHPDSKNLARAIVSKVKLAKREKQSKEKPWYQELLKITGEL